MAVCGVSKEKNLPLKQRQALVIKKVNCQLAQNLPVVKHCEVFVVKQKGPKTSTKK
jgi:hypothetical protein